MVSGGGDDAVFEVGAGFQAEDADGFDADVLVGGGVNDGGIGIVGDGAGEDVGGAAGGWDPLESTCRHASLSIL